MSEDEGEAGAEEEQRKPDASRPVTAAARRERRRAARAGDKSSAKRPSPTSKGDTKDSGARGGKEAKHSASATTEKKGRSTRSRDSAEASKKRSVFARIARFLREVIAELRKVIWPTRKQMITYTSVVLVFVVVMTAFIFGLDYGSTKLMSVVFG